MGRLIWAWKRSRDIIRYEGWRVWLWRLLLMALAPLARAGASRIFAKTLDGVDAPPPAPRHLTVGSLERGDLESVVDLMASREGRGRRPSPRAREQSRRTVLERLAAGQQCFVARVGADVVHCGWVTFCWIEWPGEHWTALPADSRRLVVLGRHEAFHSDAYTHEAWRGRRLYAVALDHILRHLRAQGVQRLYAEVALGNGSSRKTYERLGWQRLGTVFYARPRGSSRAWRWVVAKRDPFVAQPGGYLRFRSTEKTGSGLDF